MLTVRVATLVPLIVLVSKLPETPVGRPEKARLTLPVKPSMAVLDTAYVVLKPAVTV